ncbi:MAG: hypothetical protein ACREP6_01560 [Candidatus Binataceae bacterium]
MAEMMETIKDYVSSATIDRKLLLNKLSEFLAVEKGGVKLYQVAIQHVRDEQVLDKYKEFYGQTRNHVVILEKMIHELGGDPAYQSASAKIAEKKADSLLLTMSQSDGVSPQDAELNAIENILLAETKDHADWELLGKLARRSDDSRVSDILQSGVTEVEPQEGEHESFSKEHLARLSMAALSK